jgi:upstream activation factor subunit UAF30
MARSVKSSESKSNVSASSAPSAQVATPAPVAAVVEKAPRASRARAAAPVAPAVEAVQSAVASVEQSAQNVEVVAASGASEDDLSSAFADAFDKLQKVTAMLSALRSDFRQLERRTVRELKVANKSSSKRRRKPGNRSPSGFVKPTLISDELASFLGKQPGTEMARTEVTREINTYIRNHNLQDKSNGRKINPDQSLSKLLKLNATDELTYFNLQRYMSPHFAKAVKPVVEAQ